MKRLIAAAAVLLLELGLEWIGSPLAASGQGETGADNGQTYFVIDARPAEGGEAAPPAAVTAAFVPLVTSTPRADGWIVHTVAEGQTLWNIAISYGTTVNAIRELNGIPADSTVIYVGQELKIAEAADVILNTLPGASTTILQYPQLTITPTSAATSPAPTASVVPSQTPTSTPANILDRLPAERVTGAVVLFSIAVIGLGLLLRFCVFGIRQPR